MFSVCLFGVYVLSVCGFVVCVCGCWCVLSVCGFGVGVCVCVCLWVCVVSVCVFGGRVCARACVRVGGWCLCVGLVCGVCVSVFDQRSFVQARG